MSTKKSKLWQGDCLEMMKNIPDGSVSLVLTDPPYNIGVAAWDKIDGYTDWCISWLQECQRVLKPNGVLYFWHNDMAQLARLLVEIEKRTALAFMSFCIWDKGDTFRPNSWKNRRPDSATALRSWFNVCEYCLHFFNAPKDAEGSWKHTGLDRINSNPNCYKELKEWYSAEKERLGITDKDIAEFYTKQTGKKPYMLRHYFQDSQFEIPTEAVWNAVYVPLGFGKSYEELRKSYEELRKSYEELRNVHHVDAMHCNIWHRPPLPSTNRLHLCQKPEDILERLIKVSSNEGDTVLDLFMGSGSTGVAAKRTGRKFIGIELSEEYFEIAKKRIEETP